MITEDQTEVIAFLEAAVTHGGNPVTRIDTHASIVFLAGDRAWKLKRALGGRGIPIEWLVEMVRFDQEGAVRPAGGAQGPRPGTDAPVGDYDRPLP